MDRREFLKTVAQAAAVAGTAGLANPGRAAAPPRITVAGVGDLIIARRVSDRRDDAFLGAVELLRGADCTWGNSEAVLAEPHQVYPAMKEGDPHAIVPPWAADEMAFLGVDFVGTANNHTLDWGLDGLVSSLAHLERAGIAHAGAGRDLAAASRPGYFDCPAGRVAQVNCSSTFRDYFAAGSAHPYVQGRPGLNPLHVDRQIQVGAELFQGISDLQRKFIEMSGFGGFEDLVEEWLSRMPEGTAFFGQERIKAGDGFDVLETARESDVERITQATQVARRNARVVLATLHAHEARYALEQNAPFIEPFARATIDAGADLFFAAGPHVLRGIEIYQGKPIFYGLSNFVFHYETMPAIPADSWPAYGLPKDSRDPTLYAAKIPYPREARFWQAIVPLVTFEGGLSDAVLGEEITGPRVVSIELYPIKLGFGEPHWRRGTPELARGEEATVILEELARLSEPYGTSISIRDGVGRVTLG